MEITQPYVHGNSIQQSGRDDLRSQLYGSGWVKSSNALRKGTGNQGLSQIHAQPSSYKQSYLPLLSICASFSNDKMVLPGFWDTPVHMCAHTDYLPPDPTTDSQVHITEASLVETSGTHTTQA